MAKRYSIVGVEGPTDQHLVVRCFEYLGYKKYGGAPDRYDPYWARIFPVRHSDQDIYRPPDLPRVLEKGDLSIAVLIGGGSSLGKKLRATIANLGLHLDELVAVGVVADADGHEAENVVQSYCGQLEAVVGPFPKKPGLVSVASPRTGVYVFPDNATRGVVEHVLLDCGATAFSNLHSLATEYVAKVKQAGAPVKWAPFDEEKARVSAMASVLAPGASSGTSLQRGPWVTGETVKVPRLSRLVAFLQELAEGPLPKADPSQVS